MTPSEIMRGPHMRTMTDTGAAPWIVIKPLRFIPVVLVQADRHSQVMAKVAA